MMDNGGMSREDDYNFTMKHAALDRDNLNNCRDERAKIKKENKELKLKLERAYKSLDEITEVLK